MTTRPIRVLALTAGVMLVAAGCGDAEETPAVEVPAPPETVDAPVPDATVPTDDVTGTEDATTGDGAGSATGAEVPPEYDGVLAAIDLAVAEHDGAPAFEVDDGDGGTWEVHVAVGEDDIEVHVSADGSEVISSEREADLDSDDRAGLEAAGDFTLAEAVRGGIAEYGGTAPVDEVTISDEDGGTYAWEVAFADDVEVYLDISTGDVLRVETD